MYILQFNTSRSKYFEEGLRLARELGGVWDGETLILKIPDEELPDAHDMLSPLFAIVGRWSSLRATYRGEEVDPYRFILGIYFIQECAERRVEAEDTADGEEVDYCWLDPYVKGWSCKMINNVLYKLLGDGQYRSNTKYWYNFGRFDKDNSWMIDKEHLYRLLMDYAEGQGLHLCPFFRVSEVKRAVDDLPERIMPDDPSFKFYYEADYYKGKKIEVPVNIRHVPPEGSYENRPRMEYDVSKITPIWHHRDKNEADEEKDSELDTFWKDFSMN